MDDSYNSSMSIVLEEEEKDENVFEIIEELSDEEEEEKKEQEPSESSSSSNDFSLSSIKFVLGDALTGSATSFGTAAEKLGSAAESLVRASFHNHQPSPKMALDGSSDHSINSKRSTKSFVVPSFDGRSLLYGEGGKPRRAINLGRFEERVKRLQYTNEDVAEIVENKHQFQELQVALRGMGAMTDTTLKLKLHWYIRNTKKEKERRQRQELQRKEHQQQQQGVVSSTSNPVTAQPTETQVVNSVKEVMENCTSPHSVRGIYIPQKL